jgi:hypothetical protein
MSRRASAAARSSRVVLPRAILLQHPLLRASPPGAVRAPDWANFSGLCFKIMGGPTLESNAQRAHEQGGGSRGRLDVSYRLWHRDGLEPIDVSAARTHALLAGDAGSSALDDFEHAHTRAKPARRTFSLCHQGTASTRRAANDPEARGAGVAVAGAIRNPRAYRLIDSNAAGSSGLRGQVPRRRS